MSPTTGLRLAYYTVAIAVLLWLARAGASTLAVALLAIALLLVVPRLLWRGMARAGAVAIRDDDPLMLDALDTARRTWPDFLALYAQRPEHAIVKYRLRLPDGSVENVWGALLAWSVERARVRQMHATQGAGGPAAGSESEVPTSEVIDWQVVMDDDSLRGGHTQRAVFRILERDTGRLPAAYAAQLARYRDD